MNEPNHEYSPQIGIMVQMLEVLKDRVTNRVMKISESQTDFLLDGKANRIGGIIMHLVATEVYYQVISLEDRPFGEEDCKKWDVPLDLGERARKEIKGKPIKYYLDLWAETRQKTLQMLKARNDDWFFSKTSLGISHFWVWFHVMEHQANHFGQIILLLQRAPI